METCSAITKGGQQCKLKSKVGCDGKCSRHFGDSCSICWGLMNPSNSKKLDNCTHVYHKKCIDKWKKKNNTCPQCRAQIEITTYNVTIHIEPSGIHESIITSNVSMLNGLFGTDANINFRDYITDIQFSTQVEEDIRHILQEIGFPVTTFPARTQ